MEDSAAKARMVRPASVGLSKMRQHAGSAWLGGAGNPVPGIGTLPYSGRGLNKYG